MKNYIQPGDNMTFTAPAGGVTSGVPVIIGDVFVIPVKTVAATLPFAGKTDGVFELPKTNAQAWAEGVRIYYDTTTFLCTNVSGANTRRIGTAAAAAANPSALGRVRLDAVALPALNVA